MWAPPSAEAQHYSMSNLMMCSKYATEWYAISIWDCHMWYWDRGDMSCIDVKFWQTTICEILSMHRPSRKQENLFLSHYEGWGWCSWWREACESSICVANTPIALMNTHSDRLFWHFIWSGNYIHAFWGYSVARPPKTEILSQRWMSQCCL